MSEAAGGAGAGAATTSARIAPRDRDQPVSRFSKVFELNRKGLNVPRGLVIVGVMVVPLIVLGVIGKEQYWVSVALAALFVGLTDPGGDFGYRAIRMGVVAVIGALLTALAFGIGAAPWELVVLAAFVVTLLGGLALKFGLHAFVAGVLLNVWFIIAIGLPAAYKLDKVTSHTWAQVLAWLAGSALWIAFAWLMWLARGRKARAAPVPEIPGDTSPRELTRPVILFAVVRALAVSIAVAIAFGLHLEHAIWMPLATIIALKSSAEQSALVGEQRLVGALIGAVLASLCLLTIDSKHALEVIVIVFGALGASIRGVNYALYTAAIAACVLTAIDLPHPSNLGQEAQRVLWTFAGVGIAVIVMLLVDQLQKRKATTASPATT
jgi:hypothetical protein